MNKIVCNICGTSYPENASQCPICGFARSAEYIDSEVTENESTYNYVKGGRFSKANVKKRNHVKQRTAKAAVIESPVAVNEPPKKGNGLMVAIVIILLLAIITVVGYIVLRFFVPNDYIFEGLENIKLPFSEQNVDNDSDDPVGESVNHAEDPATSIEHTSITLDKTTINFEGIDSTYHLKVSVEPVSTSDSVIFSSSDESVCTVADDGLITTVGEGSAVITVICGSASAECAITCEIPVTEPQIALNRKEITFNAEGETWIVYDGPIPVSDITWSSDDSNVAAITDGKVVAVGNGDTTIYGTYGNQTVSCLIHCDFKTAEDNSGDVSEAGDDSKTYSLYNPTGLAEDVTIKVGGKFTLKLVDEDKTEVKDAEWNVSKESVCSYNNGTVKAIAAGTAKVTATYKEKDYTCIVRVIK